MNTKPEHTENKNHKRGEQLWPTKGIGLLHVANNNKLKKAKVRKKHKMSPCGKIIKNN